MGTPNHKVLGKPFKLFLIIDFLILFLSFIGTVQFANECYQLMSFAGFAAAFAWFFSLLYCVLAIVIFILLWIALRRQSIALAAAALTMQVLIRLPSFFWWYLWDIQFFSSWHDVAKIVQIAMGVAGLAGLGLQSLRARVKAHRGGKG